MLVAQWPQREWRAGLQQVESAPTKGETTVPGLLRRIGRLLATFSPQECRDFLRHPGSGHFKPEEFEDRYEDALKEPAENEAVRREDRSAKSARTGQSHQSYGCA
jgi:hypothetical protein